jgi:MoxR-like ATPase
VDPVKANETRSNAPGRDVAGFESEVLIGRDDVLATVSTLLATGERWITLVGAPGVGKTRLALEIAARSSALGDRRVIVCATHELCDPIALTATVADAAGAVPAPDPIDVPR